ncbi:MAG: PilZ domain-containing protein [Thermodesulfobacteriota bacterium]
MSRPDETVEILPADLPDALRYMRAEARMSTALPARLTASNGEMIPALLADLSPTGVMVLVDRRFSPLLPFPAGASLWIEFYLDEIEVLDAVIRVRGLKERGRFQVELGCAFVDLTDQARTAIRSKVAASKIARRP